MQSKALINHVVPHSYRDLPALVKENNFNEIKTVTTATDFIEAKHKCPDFEDKLNLAYFVAVKNDSHNVAKYLLTLGAKANADFQVSSLPELVKYDYLEKVKGIVEKPLNKNQKQYLNEALFRAVCVKNISTIDYLLKWGASARYSVRKNHLNIPLIAYAATFSTPEIVDTLLQKNGLRLIRDALFNITVNTQLNSNISITTYTEQLEKMLSLTRNSIQVKQKIMTELELIKNEYTGIIKNIMNYAQGLDLPERYFVQSREVHGLEFLKGCDEITGINFIGVSYCGKPLTMTSLKMIMDNSKDAAYPLLGMNGALFTLQDLYEIQNKSQKSLLASRTEHAIKLQGKLIEYDGTVNLIPLWCAVRYEDNVVFKIRLNAGVNPNECCDNDQIEFKYPIEFAAQLNNIIFAKQLLTHHSFDPKTLPRALIIAQKAKHQKLIELFITHLDVNQLDKKGYTLLHHAILASDLYKMQNLIMNGADVNLLCHGLSPLALVIKVMSQDNINTTEKNIYLEMIDYLLKNNANLSFTDENGSCVLSQAAETGDINLIKALLPFIPKSDEQHTDSFNLNKQNVPWYATILSHAIKSNDCLSLLACLEKEHIDFNYIFPNGRFILADMTLALSGRRCEDDDGDDLLWNKNRINKIKSQGSHLQQIAIINFLLEFGASPSKKIMNLNDNTALHLYFINIANCDGVSLDGIPNGYARLIDKFLAHGFDINQPNGDGLTLLHLAVKAQCFKAIKYLIANGADVNVQDKFGMTPMHYAAANAMTRYPATNHKIIVYLMSHDALSHIKNNADQTPYDIAHKMGDLILEKSCSFKQEYKTSLRLLNSVTENNNDNRDRFAVDKLHEDVLQYINFLNEAEPSLKSILEKMCETNHDMKKIIDVYRDPVTDDIMQMPVILHERIYNLDTLLSLPPEERRDPITGAPFKLSEIHFAMTVWKDLFYLKNYFLNKISLNENKQFEKRYHTVTTFFKRFNEGHINNKDIEPQMKQCVIL